MKKISHEQLGKLIELLADNGYAVVPLAAFQGARPVQSAPTPTVEAAPVETATSERKCSYCGESGHNVRTCPKKAADEAKAKPQAKPSAPVQAPAPAAPSLPSFDLDLSDLGSVGVPEVSAPAPAPVKSTPAPKAKPTPPPAVASKSEIDSELDALFNF